MCILNDETPSATVTLGTSGGGSAVGANYPNASISASTYPFTISAGTGITSPWGTITASPWLGNGISTDGNGNGKLKLSGDEADIEINGVSLSKTINEIHERLNILTVNPELEKEWDQLRELGNQYRALEAKLKEQSNMWAKLKSKNNGQD